MEYGVALVFDVGNVLRVREFQQQSVNDQPAIYALTSSGTADITCTSMLGGLFNVCFRKQASTALRGPSRCRCVRPGAITSNRSETIRAGLSPFSPDTRISSPSSG